MPFVGLDTVQLQTLERLSKPTCPGIWTRSRCTAGRVRDVDRGAHLANIVLCHAACNITFVLEDQQRGSHKTLGDISNGVAK